MYYSSNKTQRGYSFVEVLVAIAVLLIGIVGPLTIASKALNNALYAREQNTALFLAQEGIEAAHLQRGYFALYDYFRLNYGGTYTWAWVTNTNQMPPACLNGSPCGFRIRDDGVIVSFFECANDGGGCRLSYNENAPRFKYVDADGTGNETIYTRELYFSEYVGVAVRVRSVVKWDSITLGGEERSVELETVLYDIHKYEDYN